MRPGIDPSSASYYGPLNALTWNMGYHNEHHDFVRVPGSRLPALHAIARGTYGSLTSHGSWTRILLHFMLAPTLGHHSRITREMKAVLVGREKRSASFLGISETAH